MWKEVMFKKEKNRKNSIIAMREDMNGLNQQWPVNSGCIWMVELKLREFIRIMFFKCYYKDKIHS